MLIVARLPTEETGFSMSNNHSSIKFSIIIVNWNRCDDVLDTLSRVFQLCYQDFEVICVDNGSDNDDLAEIEVRYPNVKSIRLHTNTGCEFANNVGVKNASGEYILFLDSDAHFAEGMLEKMVSLFDADPSIGVIEPRVIRPEDGLILNEPKYWPKKNIFIGCVVAFRARILREIGHRPDDFFLYSSEVDLALRLVENDFKIIHEHSILGFHRESAAARTSGVYYYYMTRNVLWVIWIHYPLGAAIYETIFHLAFSFIKSASDRALRQYFRGVLSGFSGLRKFALRNRSVKKRYAEARVYPGILESYQILIAKLWSR